MDSKSRRTAKLHNWFKSYHNFTNIFFYSKTSNVAMWGVYPEAIDWNISLRTQILIWGQYISIWIPKHFKKWGQFYRFFGSESCSF